MEIAEDKSRQVGRRAEEVAEWYFRLNGFFLIPGFIVHPDLIKRTPRTEADLLGIRLKHSKESSWRSSGANQHFSKIGRVDMTDDPIFNTASFSEQSKKHLAVMVEVKAGECAINGPWSPEHLNGNDTNVNNNMERALAKLGFGDASEVPLAAKSMYDQLRYEGSEFVVQYFAVGKAISTNLQEMYPKLKQITFDQIGTFLRYRFHGFPEKIPLDTNIKLWDGFGDIFARWFESRRQGSEPSNEICQMAVKSYIEKGSIDVRQVEV